MAETSAPARYTELTDLYSDRAKMTGPGIVGLDPRVIRKVISFSGGYPDATSLPIQDIIEATRVALERDGEWALQYAFGSGIPELVEQLRIKLERDQGIKAGVENILITNGGSQALGLIYEMFVNPGDVILSEAPYFLGAVHYARQNGAEVHEIGLDDEGLIVADLEAELKALRAAGKRAKFLYLVPNFQNPTGITYSLERRKQIIALAQEYGLPILEDDAYFDLRFDGEKVPTFYTLDGSGLVMYCGTFSKILSAGIRLGWVVAAPDVIAHLSGLKTDYGTGAFASAVAAEFAGSGTLLEHIQELKALYHARRDVMLAALEAEMPAGTSWTHPTGGFFIWVTLPAGVTSAEVTRLAQQRGVGVSDGTYFYTRGGGESNVRLSYSFNTADEIRTGVRILGDVIREVQAVHG
ncbi:MAG: PLP-dependent aminotransferase family protein [Chloroflexi bacterium]|nr:MAG: PLP-dependent aminotransferase family protein [Chloroflexota bacterium]